MTTTTTTPLSMEEGELDFDESAFTGLDEQEQEKELKRLAAETRLLEMKVLAEKKKRLNGDLKKIQRGRGRHRSPSSSRSSDYSQSSSRSSSRSRSPSPIKKDGPAKKQASPEKTTTKRQRSLSRSRSASPKRRLDIDLRTKGVHRFTPTPSPSPPRFRVTFSPPRRDRLSPSRVAGYDSFVASLQSRAPPDRRRHRGGRNRKPKQSLPSHIRSVFDQEDFEQRRRHSRRAPSDIYYNPQFYPDLYAEDCERQRRRRDPPKAKESVFVAPV